jgi:hypothetical protein
VNELEALYGRSDTAALIFLLHYARDPALAAKRDRAPPHGSQRQMQNELNVSADLPFPGNGEEESAAAYILGMGGDFLDGMPGGLDLTGEIDGIAPETPLLDAGGLSYGR